MLQDVYRLDYEAYRRDEEDSGDERDKSQGYRRYDISRNRGDKAMHLFKK